MSRRPLTDARLAEIEARMTPLQRAEIELAKRAVDYTMAMSTAGDEPTDETIAADLAHRRAAIAYVVEELRAYGKDTEWTERKLREISESIS